MPAIKMTYYCEVCQKHFTRRSSFIKHCQIHRKVKYSCSVCQSSFKLKSSFLDHNKEVHGEEIVPNYRTIMSNIGEINDSLIKPVRKDYQWATFQNFAPPTDIEDDLPLLVQIKTENCNFLTTTNNVELPTVSGVLKHEFNPPASDFATSEESTLKNDVKPVIISHNDMPVPTVNLQYSCPSRVTSSVNSKEAASRTSILERLLTEPDRNTEHISIHSSPNKTKSSCSTAPTSLLKNLLLLDSKNGANNKLKDALSGYNVSSASLVNSQNNSSSINNNNNNLAGTTKNKNEDSSANLIKIVNVFSLADNSERNSSFSTIKSKSSLDNQPSTAPDSWTNFGSVAADKSRTQTSLPNIGCDFSSTKLPVQENFVTLRAYLEKHARQHQSKQGITTSDSYSIPVCDPSQEQISSNIIQFNHTAFNTQHSSVIHTGDCQSQTSNYSVTIPMDSQNHISPTPFVIERILTVPKVNVASEYLDVTKSSDTSILTSSKTMLENILSMPRTVSRRHL